MEQTTVFAKTPRGIAEVAVRGGALSLTARRVLIMVDGRRSIAELAPLLRPGEIDTVVAQLEMQGFVQRLGEAPPPPPSPRTVRYEATGYEYGPGSDAEEERSPLMTLDEARRRAVRELNDRLGPDATTMSIRIEQCTNAEDLRERLREAERLVAGFLGDLVAQDFVRALRRR
jgi:hypothetical protein